MGAVKTISAEEFATQAGVAPSTVRHWARKGFPGAVQEKGPKGTLTWRFPKVPAARYADLVRKADAIFKRT